MKGVIARLSAAAVAEQRAIRRAARSMPLPVPWEWALPRLIPLLAGPRLDQPGEPIVRAVASNGCAIVFGLDLDGAMPLVDEMVAERWECSPDQLLHAAMTNLRGRAALVDPAAVTRGTLSGRVVRLLREPSACASSLVLVPDELARVLGSHDQVLAAPGGATLLSLPVETPPAIVAQIVIDLESQEPYPLMLDPFLLVGGELVWAGEDSLGAPFE